MIDFTVSTHTLTESQAAQIIQFKLGNNRRQAISIVRGLSQGIKGSAINGTMGSSCIAGKTKPHRSQSVFRYPESLVYEHVWGINPSLLCKPSFKSYYKCLDTQNFSVAYVDINFQAGGVTHVVLNTDPMMGKGPSFSLSPEAARTLADELFTAAEYCENRYYDFEEGRMASEMENTSEPAEGIVGSTGDPELDALIKALSGEAGSKKSSWSKTLRHLMGKGRNAGDQTS